MLPAANVPPCPECETGTPLARRDFIRVLGTGAAALTVGGLTPLQTARAARADKQKQAEGMIFELFQTLTADQKAKITRAWDHKPTATDKVTGRLATGNAAVNGLTIEKTYDKKQVKLLDDIFRSVANGDTGYKSLSRDNRFDASGDFESISAIIYGEPAEGKKFSLVFTGHHLTVRCDGNSEDATAFGGPLYYGHSPSGYATTNVFYGQTKAANDLFRALDKEARKVALITDKNKKWKDEHGTIKVPKKGETVPGLSFKDMSKDQQAATLALMKELVSPYRKEDGDEVMELIKATGGMEKVSMAFYEETERTEKEPWSFWRLEGPGFVWSYRALPHVHTFVHVNSKLA